MGITSLITVNEHFVFASRSALSWLQAAVAMQTCHHAAGVICGVYTVGGEPLTDLDAMPAVALACVEHHDVPWPPLALPGSAVSQLDIQSSEDGFLWHCPAAQRDLLRLTLPTHLLRPLGWRCAWLTCGTALCSLQPCNAAPLMPPPHLRHLQRLWLFSAQLRVAEDTCRHGQAVSHHVELDLISLWQGQLPATLQLSELEDMWRAASQATCLLPGSRVLSGHQPLAASITIGSLHGPDAAVRRNRASGRVRLSLHPEIRGGGAKTEQKDWAVAQLATLCLAQGLDLKATTQFAEQLACQTSQAKLHEALDLPAPQQWPAAQALARQASLEVPAVSNTRSGLRELWPISAFVIHDPTNSRLLPELRRARLGCSTSPTPGL